MVAGGLAQLASIAILIGWLCANRAGQYPLWGAIDGLVGVLDSSTFNSKEGLRSWNRLTIIDLVRGVPLAFSPFVGPCPAYEGLFFAPSADRPLRRSRPCRPKHRWKPLTGYSNRSPTDCRRRCRKPLLVLGADRARHPRGNVAPEKTTRRRVPQTSETGAGTGGCHGSVPTTTARSVQRKGPPSRSAPGSGKRPCIGPLIHVCYISLQ